MSAFDDFVSKFDSKQRRELQFAAGIKVEILPLASRTLTKALGGGIRRGTITTIFGNPYWHVAKAGACLRIYRC